MKQAFLFEQKLAANPYSLGKSAQNLWHRLNYLRIVEGSKEFKMTYEELGEKAGMSYKTLVLALDELKRAELLIVINVEMEPSLFHLITLRTEMR